MYVRYLLVCVGALIGGLQAQQVTDDTFFYGDSPPVYPPPPGRGTGQWAQAYQKAKAFVEKLTIEEKTNLTTGFIDNDNTCSGNIHAVPRLGFPGLCLSDAGNGLVRSFAVARV